MSHIGDISMNSKLEISDLAQKILRAYESNSRINAIIFDCDGVLIDSETIGSKVEVEALNKCGCPITLEEYDTRFAGRTTKDAFKILAAENNIILHPEFIKSVEKNTLLILENEAVCVAGIKDALKKITLPKAVASNAYDEKLHTLLRVHDLLPYFKGHVYSADLVERPKPYPDIYELVARKMNVEPEKCIVIEDSVAGVKSARAAGMHVFGFFGASHQGKNCATLLEDAGVEIIFNEMCLLPVLINLYINTH
jgi:HAD superfamily hydrolase (TIGR01509 family)